MLRINVDIASSGADGMKESLGRQNPSRFMTACLYPAPSISVEQQPVTLQYDNLRLLSNLHSISDRVFTARSNPGAAITLGACAGFHAASLRAGPPWLRPRSSGPCTARVLPRYWEASRHG